MAGFVFVMPALARERSSTGNQPARAMSMDVSRSPDRAEPDSMRTSIFTSSNFQGSEEH